MSIEDLITHKVSAGMLFPLIPRASGSAPRRAMFVSEDIWSLLSTEHQDDDMEDRLGILQADLEQFAEGRSIDPKYLFLLYPASEGVWEIRSVRPDPSIRVLGFFAKLDVFIATNLALRENLGGWESRDWKDVKRLARTRWGHLFHTYQPLKSEKLSDLVTGAINGKYFKT
jgi:hypothetical protein